jgi:3D (Asp-Asp-Asp) domain-containing protein
VRRMTAAVLGVAVAALAAAPAVAAGGPRAGSTLTMVATAYGPTLQDNYPYGPVDAFGQPLTAGDVAVDPRVIPLGTCLFITGYRSPYLPRGGLYAEADDTGGAIKGDRVDIFYSGTEAQINEFGIQRVRVRVLGPSPDPLTRVSGTVACAVYEHGGTGAAARGPGARGKRAGTTAHRRPWERRRRQRDASGRRGTVRGGGVPGQVRATGGGTAGSHLAP